MTNPDRRVAILWNIHSGWEAGAEQAKAVQQILRQIDPDLNFEEINAGQNIRELSDSLVSQGTDLLIAAGGDGTINAVASALVSKPVALGVIPAGTLNHFARDLGLSLEPAQAARQLQESQEITVDIGEVNGRVFVNNSVLGLYPVYRAAREQIEAKGFGSNAVGRFIAVVGGLLKVFWRFPHLKIRITTDEGVRQLRSPFVLVANNEHELERGRPGRRTRLNDGHLWVYVLRRCTRWAMLRYFFQFLTGRFSRRQAFYELRAKEVRIDTRSRNIRVGIDGEIVRMKTPLEYRSLPGALRVLAPVDSPLTETSPS